MNENNKILAEFAGFKVIKPEHKEIVGVSRCLVRPDGVVQLYTSNPDVDLWELGIDFYSETTGLSDLFRWVVPKLCEQNQTVHLKEIVIDPAMCNKLMYYSYFACDVTHSDGMTEHEEFQTASASITKALADACVAYIKNLRGEK